MTRAVRPLLLLPLALATLACGAEPPAAAPGAADPAAGSSPAAPAGGAPDAGSPAAAVETVDAGGDCAGLVPASPPAAVIVHDDAAGGACLGGTSDGAGSVATGVRAATGAVRWTVRGPDGGARGTFAADPPVVPAPSGFHALVRLPPTPGGGDPRLDHVLFTPQGAEARRTTVSPDPALLSHLRWSFGADPSGGAVVALGATSNAGNHWSRVDAARFDAAGERRFAAERITTSDSAAEPMFLAAGTSTRGESLVLSQHSAQLDVVWLDAGGDAVAAADRAEPFDAVMGSGALRHDVELVALLDGSVAVRSDGAFRRRYDAHATRSGPLPGWLSTRATARLRLTRGARGYAALPAPGAPSTDCSQRIELLSASGRLCGAVTIRDPGGACTTGAVDQGRDGTVVQQSPRDACAVRFWPGLLGAPRTD